MNKGTLTALRELALLVGDGDLALTMLGLEARKADDATTARRCCAVVLRTIADQIHETADHFSAEVQPVAGDADDAAARAPAHVWTNVDHHHTRRIALASQVLAGVAAMLRKSST